MSDNFPTMPQWPQPPIPQPPPPSPKKGQSPLLGIGLAISMVVNVGLFVALLSVLLLARAGAFAANQSIVGRSTSPPPSSSPSATFSPTSTPPWLQVAPTAVQLACTGDQHMQVVVLANSGPQMVQWQVDFGGPADQSPVDVAPGQGNLQAGASMSLQIQTRGHASNQQGVIRFDPATQMAGAPPSLSYTIADC